MVGNITPEQWRPDPIPYQLQYVWSWFLELHVARRFNPKGRPLPIDYQDMVNWSMLTERKLGPFEIKLIRQLDQRFFFVLNNPMGVVLKPKQVNQEQADNDIAGMLRAMRALKAPGMVELPTGKPISVPALTFKSGGK